jgi:hypothetical protein
MPGCSEGEEDCHSSCPEGGAAKAADAGTEESEAPAMGEPASSPDDPGMYHHHAYPSDTIVCPYTGRSYPREEPKETPAPSKSLAPDGQPPANPAPAPQEGDAEESSAHPDLDTMEYRPSDDPDGEFDNNPF